MIVTVNLKKGKNKTAKPAQKDIIIYIEISFCLHPTLFFIYVWLWDNGF